MQIDWRKVKQFFFKAMMRGWANNAEKFIIPQMPNYKFIEFSEGSLYLLDGYSKTPESDKSTGITTIYHVDLQEHIPIWIMHYGGWYRKEVMPFLKEVLSETYRKNLFCGGRGPAYVTQCPKSKFDYWLHYENSFDKNHFKEFSGSEVIYTERLGKAGTHKYFGMSLID